MNVKQNGEVPAFAGSAAAEAASAGAAREGGQPEDGVPTLRARGVPAAKAVSDPRCVTPRLRN
jgi:hypothetical protein